MKRFVFSMGLPAHKLKEYYRGNVKNVVVTTDDGLRLQLPLEVFRPFVSEAGIYGFFVVYVDDNHKLVRLDKKD
ncbi:DUF2835 family protein [Kaarinaea lacus]